MITAVYAGTFDPITLGHWNIIKRSIKVCDKLIVAIGHNPAKKTLFSLEERLDLIKHSLANLDFLNQEKVDVAHFEGLLVNFAKTNGATLLIRGVRSSSDFEYETQLAQMNKDIDSDIDTLFLPTEQNLSLVSSSATKELARYGVPLTKMVSRHVENALYKKLGVH